jgi:hypothetical protein
MIPVAVPDIIDDRIRPYAVQAICLVKIFDGDKTANRLCQQEHDKEQENSRMTTPRPAFVIPAMCFLEIWEERHMRHNTVIVFSLFCESMCFQIGNMGKNKCLPVRARKKFSHGQWINPTASMGSLLYVGGTEFRRNSRSSIVKKF